jgi:hypothetical protein
MLTGRVGGGDCAAGLTATSSAPTREVPGRNIHFLLRSGQKQPDAKDKLKESFTAAKNLAAVEVYPAKHGWCVPDIPMEGGAAIRAGLGDLAGAVSHCAGLRPARDIGVFRGQALIMCRNIKTLFNFEPPATELEICDASLQFVRKLSGFNIPSAATRRAPCPAVILRPPP